MKFLRPPVYLLTAILSLIVLAVPAAFASSSGGTDEWKPVDPSELALKSPVVEKDADAEVLYWEVKVDDSSDNDLITSHYIRLKIFTERGKDSQSKVDIPYFDGTKVKDIAARTIKADGSIIELKKEDVFERTIVKLSGLKLKAKTFAVPGIESGAIIEYRWREVASGRGANHMRLQFQREIPVERVTYYVKPQFSTYGMRFMPFHVPDTVRFVPEKDGYHSVTMTNVPAFREESQMPPEDQVRPWIFIYYTQMFNQSVSEYWGAVGRAVHEYLKPQMKVNDEIRKASAEIVGDATTSDQKLSRLYEFCRTKIKNYADDASGMTEDQLKKVKENKSPSDTLKRGIGNGADIDLLFAALATAAGFDAHIAMTGNRGDIFFDPSFANSYFIDPSSIAINVDGKWRFFNPGLTYIPYGMLRWQEEGQQALISDAKQPQWIKTPMSGPQLTQEKRTAKLRLLEDGTLEGDVKIEYTGQMALERKEYNDDDSPAEREETLKKMVKERMDTAELTNIQVENVQDPVKPFVYEYHVSVPGYAQRTGKRLFLQPAFFERGAPAVFTASTRQNNIYFHYPWSEEDEVTIELPAGFTLDNADAPAPFQSANISAYRVTIGATKDQHTLLYRRSFFFGGNEAILFPVGGYELLKNYFDRLYKADNHTITLKQEAATAQAPVK
jgi:hypothetical protein